MQHSLCQLHLLFATNNSSFFLSLNSRHCSDTSFSGNDKMDSWELHYGSWKPLTIKASWGQNRAPASWYRIQYVPAVSKKNKVGTCQHCPIYMREDLRQLTIITQWRPIYCSPNVSFLALIPHSVSVCMLSFSLSNSSPAWRGLANEGKCHQTYVKKLKPAQ